MRKIVSILTAVIFAVGSTSVFAVRYNDVYDGMQYRAAIENLSDYGIVSGYNGSFNPYGCITRAEAAKIVSLVTGTESDAASKAGLKKFGDVEIGSWYSGYVNAVADNKYILGYPNGDFLPNNNITFAEMTTITLRMLGYNSTVLGQNWPYSYMVKADELGITDGISLNDNDLISRGQTCQLIDNAMKKEIWGTGVKLSSLMSEIEYSDPVVVKSYNPYDALSLLGVSGGNIGNYVIVRDGYSATVNDIQLYDVIYKSEKNKKIYIYCDKISGIYKEAYPSKADIEQADISGEVIEIETQSAKDKLNESVGAYKLNSRVTALLGKDGKIVDVVDINTAQNDGYGVLISYSEEVSSGTDTKGELSKYITVLSSSGREVSYETKTDYSKYIGLVGKVTFDSEAMAKFSVASNTVNLSGVVDKSKNKIGSTYLTSDAVLIELVYEPETHTGTAVAKKIDIDDIVADEIYKSNVVYALSGGEFGDVSFAVLRNVTNNDYVYGILTDSSVNTAGMNAMSSYTVTVNGVSNKYSSDFGQGIEKGSPVAMIVENGSLKSIQKLRSSNLGKINAIDETRVKLGSVIYDNAQNVQIYTYNSADGYVSVSFEQAKKYTGSSARAYFDAKSVNGGNVRVLVIYK